MQEGKKETRNFTDTNKYTYNQLKLRTKYMQEIKNINR